MESGAVAFDASASACRAGEAREVKDGPDPAAPAAARRRGPRATGAPEHPPTQRRAAQPRGAEHDVASAVELEARERTARTARTRARCRVAMAPGPAPAG